MRRIFALAFAACTPTRTPTPTPTQTPTQAATYEDVSAALEPIRAAGGVPALAAAAWRGNQLLALGATGTRKQGGDVRRSNAPRDEGGRRSSRASSSRRSA